ncbi:melanocyte-stimulating hormone receptor-like [Exaiptasia diaphana]|uniref:G-protein coupled receptors family 1 profile domain-containing protein n=1 Tax=Exaiptasia diaphana TaxID=2652724 RepID=A0A913X308_EXADI|nr:melanocyte-stimulating hormone receptor-like [Exaiptasia diaphana]
MHIFEHEDYIIICLNGVLALAAAVTNFLFVLAILKTPSLHTPSNILLCFLAFSDFGVGFVVQPLFITSAVVSQERMHFFLNSMTIASILLYGASVMTMTAIAVDRYLALVLHLQYRTIVTVSRTIKFKLILFFLALCGYFLRFALPTNLRYIFIIIGILFCIFISSFCHIKIQRIVRRHRRQIIDQAMAIANQFPSSFVPPLRQGKSITTMYYINGLFVICLLPYLIGVALLLQYGELPSVIIYRYCAWNILTLKSALNPFLYCWRMRDTKCAIKTLVISAIKKMYCCKR